MATPEIVVWESNDDLIKLAGDNYNLQFARSVIGKDGELTFNVVWKSFPLAPRTKISWQPVYALNWALSIPTDGQTVTVGTAWQPCDLGAAYDITNRGTFYKSPGGGTPKYLNIRTNEFSGLVHIVVGMQNGNNGYDIIYVDPYKLPMNSDARYQPQEKCRWWYEVGSRSSTMITGDGTTCDEYDMSKSYLSSTYKYAQGIWADSPNPPAGVETTGVLRPAGMDPASVASGGDSGELAERVSSIERSIQLLLTTLTGNQMQQTGGNDMQQQKIAARSAFQQSMNGLSGV